MRHRQEAYEHVADVVAQAMAKVKPVVSPKTYKWKGRECSKGRYSGSLEISRRVGRDMRRTLYVLQKGDSDAMISTLADLAEATGHTLQIVMKPKRIAKKLPPPGGFERQRGEPDGRCPYCSFMPTSDSDFCDVHKPKRAKVRRLRANKIAA